MRQTNESHEREREIVVVVVMAAYLDLRKLSCIKWHVVVIIHVTHFRRARPRAAPAPPSETTFELLFFFLVPSSSYTLSFESSVCF